VDSDREARSCRLVRTIHNSGFCIADVLIDFQRRHDDIVLNMYLTMFSSVAITKGAILRVSRINPIHGWTTKLYHLHAILSCIRHSTFDANKGTDENEASTIILPRILERIRSMSLKHASILESLQGPSSPSAHSSTKTSELSALAPAVALYKEYEKLTLQLNDVLSLKSEAMESKDDEMVTECRAEENGIYDILKSLGASMTEAVIPKDPDDYHSDAIIEVRAGTGGDEACLFCGELLSAYQKTATTMGWRFEVLSDSKTNLGGTKEAAVSITTAGNAYKDDSTLGPYGFFRFESGVHRVQRVPVNDVRIHTSAVSVAILPSASGDDQNSTELLPSSELKIETMRASGAGGQHVNTTESAVRITHIPTGITASISDERSQHKNKAKAMKLITARVRDQKREEEARKRGEVRSSLMGGGDRSERIRTYNFPQDRVTDHRSKQSEYGIAKMLTGDSDVGLVQMFEPLLRQLRREELLKELDTSKSKD